MKKTTPWSGRFSKETDKMAEELNASISFDRRLFGQDILGSVAHARVLHKAGILKKGEAIKIIKGLRSVEKDIASKRFRFTPGMEDIHMAIEKRLMEKIGPVGGKLHTGRSRNDQAALDERLYLKQEIRGILALIEGLKRTLLLLPKQNLDAVMPGYTHLQRAQPVLFSHHLLAYCQMLKRDSGRLDDCLKRTDSTPLGSGALAGTTFPIDREFVARELGFADVSHNSLDAVSDRDFAVEIAAAAS